MYSTYAVCGLQEKWQDCSFRSCPLGKRQDWRRALASEESSRLRKGERSLLFYLLRNHHNETNATIHLHLKIWSPWSPLPFFSFYLSSFLHLLEDRLLLISLTKVRTIIAPFVFFAIPSRSTPESSYFFVLQKYGQNLTSHRGSLTRSQ